MYEHRTWTVVHYPITETSEDSTKIVLKDEYTHNTAMSIKNDSVVDVQLDTISKIALRLKLRNREEAPELAQFLSAVIRRPSGRVGDKRTDTVQSIKPILPPQPRIQTYSQPPQDVVDHLNDDRGDGEVSLMLSVSEDEDDVDKNQSLGVFDIYEDSSEKPSPLPEPDIQESEIEPQTMDDEVSSRRLSTSTKPQATSQVDDVTPLLKGGWLYKYGGSGFFGKLQKKWFVLNPLTAVLSWSDAPGSKVQKSIQLIAIVPTASESALKHKKYRAENAALSFTFIGEKREVDVVAESPSSYQQWIKGCNTVLVILKQRKERMVSTTDGQEPASSVEQEVSKWQAQVEKQNKLGDYTTAPEDDVGSGLVF